MSTTQRYSRQVILPEIGPAGQQRLQRARLLCVGAGGLGCAALPYLAGAGIGRITIIDPDQVQRSNLHRQVLFGETDLDRPKAEVAAQRLANLNPEIEIVAMQERLSDANVEVLLREHDVVLDGSDNYATKYLLGDASVKSGVPLVYGSVTGMEAMVTVFDTRYGPCLRCLFPEPPAGWVPNCAEAGVLGPLVGMTGTIQAAEAVKLLVAGDQPGELRSLAGRLWVLDARDMSSRQLRMPRRDDCAVCAGVTRLPDRNEDAADTAVADIDAEAVARLESAIFVDVREADEYREGHIAGAVHCPLSLLAEASPTLPPAAHYVIYCSRGPRARTAAAALADHGIGPLYCLHGGLMAWPGELQQPG